MRNRLLFLSGLVGVALGASCAVHQTDVPGLTGPSTLAHSVTISVSPDRISQDGASQSAVTVQVNGPDGHGMNGASVRVDMLVNGTVTDFGTLSARTIVTGSDGTARTIFTAPSPPPPPTNTTVNTVSIRASLIGTDAQTSVPVTADIKLMPVGVILPPADTPTVVFTIAPPPVSVNITSTFDASLSCPGAVDAAGNCVITTTSSRTITSYSWNFGDGGTASGKVATHAFTTPGNFSVTLTVTNDRGISASKTQSVLIGAAASAGGDWVFSPAAPSVGDTVLFNADGIIAPPGRTLVQFSWNFGDPASASNTASGFQATHQFAVAGSYTVVLSVADDIGQKTTLAHQVTVGTGAPLATFSASPSAGLHTMTFDASGSIAVGGATITSYQWSFGDGAFAGPSASPTTTHAFPAAGSFTVTLTVKDSLGRTGIFSNLVTVP